MARTNDEIATKYGIADTGHDFFRFCQQAQELADKFHCASCTALATSKMDLRGLALPYYSLSGLDSAQQNFCHSTERPYETLINMARELSVRYAKRRTEQEQHAQAA
ncbi:hypothetical protein MUN82_04025 [Hymenobacter aerilatus]|uniref:Uncharacterized protein n=1 Tax=Hymenobacter aerilatus TaxID=2932251 RepID=A0A8T9SX08_9BACT|nr:hypothetical protein [Hymenobacter aerilatus]UOR06267.1 hypothetical protein MUN82_04025 [Hymenobacter aerilatus]